MEYSLPVTTGESISYPPWQESSAPNARILS